MVLWVSGDGVHDGMPGFMVPDGRVAWSTSGDGVLVEGVTGAYKPDPTERDCEIVPADDVTGWRARCECGWLGPVWKRVTSSSQRDHAKRRVYVPHQSIATPPVACEDDMKKEWAAHAIPATAVTEIEAAAKAVKTAQARLDRAVTRGRATALTWAVIGAAAGITRQTAHERWNKPSNQTN